MSLTFYDAFHGIGGFRYGLEQAGMKCVGGCEIDKYACQAYGVINNEQCEPTDITTVDPVRLPNFDVFVGGFPCQDLSIAGQRKGFDGKRSVLFFEILRICEVKRPTYILLENVTGLFSHNNGETFGTVLKSLDELGYDAEWQVHNSAAYVPQNRERVFIIGHLRGRSTRTIFPFGNENSNPIKIVGKLAEGFREINQVLDTSGISTCLKTMQGGCLEPKVLVTRDYDQLHVRDVVTCLDANYAKGLDNHQARTGVMEPVVSIDMKAEKSTTRGGMFKEEYTGALDHNCNIAVTQGYRIRKLTPLECFRLQSYPDEWYYKLKEAGISDSQLYKMAGNGVSSIVAFEIAKRMLGDDYDGKNTFNWGTERNVR
jgi:DNA (cytosine-5)-methyltransferase 1